MSWQQYIEAANKRGFRDVAILDRGDGRVLAASGGLASKPADRRAINENQELLGDLGRAKTVTYGA